MISPLSACITSLFSNLCTSLSILRARQAKVRAHARLGGCCKQCSHHFPMVLLGLFPRTLSVSDKRLHRKPTPFRPSQSTRRAFSWFPPHPGAAVLFLSDGICLCNCGDPNGRDSRARSSFPCNGFHVRVDDPCVLPAGVLGLGSQWMGIQMGSDGLCR